MTTALANWTGKTGVKLHVLCNRKYETYLFAGLIREVCTKIIDHTLHPGHVYLKPVFY